MMLALAITYVLLMLKEKPQWVYNVVTLVFIVNGIYIICNNDIIVPMELMTNDFQST